MKPTMVKAKYAFMPMPGQSPKGRLAHSPMIMVAMNEDMAVAKTRPS